MVNNYFGIYVQALLAKNSVTKLQKELNAIKDLQIKVNPTFGKINKSEVNRINQELKQQLQEKIEEASKIDIKPEIDKDAVNEATKDVDKLANSFKEELSPAVEDTAKKFNFFENFANKTTGTMNQLIGIMGKVAIWGVATNAIYGTKRALGELFDTYVELENKLISIERVTNNFDMGKVFNNAYNSSQKYGASLTDMLNSVEEIARSYSDLNEQQVNAAAEAGILASTIAEMDGQTAVEAIIAVSEAYGFAIENGERLIDIANEVDNNFAVTAANIAKAWEKSAATAKTFGVEIENLTGYIAAISTVTQESGEVIGNGLKTIFSRITTMDTAISAIGSAGVDVYDKLTGEVRDVQDILEDLAGTWDNLSDAQRQNIGVQVAGRYQLTRFLALMNNWSIATEATATALNSEGSAARENQKYLESYAAKLQQLENSQTKLAETINNGNIAGIGKTWIDVKIAITDVADKFFQVADATTVLAGVLASLVVFLSKTANGNLLLVNTLKFVTTEEKAAAIATSIREKGLIKNRLALVLNTYAEKINQKAVALSAASEIEAAVGATAHSVALGIEAKAATVAAGAIGLLSKALFSIPGLAFVALIGVMAKSLIDKANAAKEAKDAISEEATAIANNKEKVTSYVKKLEDLLKLKKELNDVDYEANFGEDESKMLDALAEKYSQISEELKSQNISLERKLELIDEEDKKTAKAAKKEYERLKNNFSYRADELQLNNSDETTTVYSKNRKWDDLNGWEKTARVVTLGYAYNSTNFDSFDKLADDYSKIYEEGQKYYRLIGDITNKDNEYINKIKEEGLAHAKTIEDLENLDKVLNAAQESYKETGSQGIEVYKKALEDLGLGEAEIALKIAETSEGVMDATSYWENYKASLKEAGEALSEFNSNNLDATEMFFGVGEGYEEAIQTMNEYINLFGENSILVQNMANDLANSFTFLGEKIFENGEDLLANKDKLNMIRETLAIAKTDTEAYSEAVANGTLYVAKGYEQEWEAVRNAKIAELEVEKTTLENKIKIWQAVITGEKTLAEANSELAQIEGTNAQNKVKTLRDYWNTFKEWVKGIVTGYKAVDNASKGNNDAAQKNLDSLQARLNDVNVQISKWKDMKIVGTTVDDFKKLNDTSSKTKSIYNEVENALRKYSDAVEEVDNELKILQEQQKRNIEGSSAWFNNYAKQEQVVRKYQNAINTYIQQLQIQLRNEQLTSEEKTKLMNKIQDLRLEYEKLNTTVYENIEAQKKYYKGEIEDKLDSIKNLEKTRHEDAINHIKKEREAFKKQIDEQLDLLKKAKDARTYEQDLKELQEQRLDILNQISRLEGDDSRLAKSKLKDLYDQLDDLDKQLSDLNFDRDIDLRENALDELETNMEDYYDRLEEIENEKNELITNSISDAKDSLDNLNWSLNGLRDELNKWTNNLSNFSHWADGFDALVSTMPQQNIVSATMPITTTDENGNPVTTEITFQITGSSKDAKDIATEVVDKLKQAGVLTNKN